MMIVEYNTYIGRYITPYTYAVCMTFFYRFLVADDAISDIAVLQTGRLNIIMFIFIIHDGNAHV